jgi:hypothetical protein
MKQSQRHQKFTEALVSVFVRLDISGCDSGPTCLDCVGYHLSTGPDYSNVHEF